MPSSRLSESIEWLSKVFAGAGAGAWRADVETGTVQYTEALQAVFGMERPVMVLADWVELLHPDDRPRVLDAWEAAIRGKANYAVEYRVVDSRGTVRWIEARGFLEVADTGHRIMFGFAQEATARKTAERRLAEVQQTQAAQNQALAELSRSEVWRSLDLSRVLGAITKVGAECLRVERVGIWLYNDERSAIILADLFEQTSGDHTAGTELPRSSNPPYFEALASDRALNVGDARTDPRTRLFGPDYLIPLGITSMMDAPVRRAGKAVGVVCCEHVGPPRVWTEQDASFAGSLADYAGLALELEQKRQIETQLLHSQRLESLGRLAGGVAHDFNNLLMAIMASAELARASALEGAVEVGLIDEVLTAAGRAAGLTQQLLTFARRSVVAPRLVQLDDLIRAAQRLLSRVLGDKIQLEVELGAQHHDVLVDPGQFEQLLMNLAVNARDAMTTGGVFRLETQLEASPAQAGDSSQGETVVVLVVRDSGVGVAPEHLSRIFEPFFTTKGVGRGTGLGLASCYGIVQQAGGHISVRSESGQGTEFRIRLPLAAPSNEASMPDATSLIPQASGETLLVVEDDEAVRRLVVRGLTRLGYVVLSANSGASGLELACQHSEIRLVVMDVMMPGMSGVEAARSLRSTLPEAPVLFVSGYTDDGALRDGALRGDIHFLAKPFSAAALGERVRQLLDQGR